jgi:outer membrane lipoprotein-sorting protein
MRSWDDRQGKSEKVKGKSSLMAKASRRTLFAFCLFTFYFALAACALFRTQPPLQEASAEQLTDLLRQREAAIQTMKGLFQAHIKGPGIPLAQRIEGVMFFRRPNTLRLQGFNHLGGPLFDFRLANDLYALRLATTGKVYAGKAAELDRIGKIGRPFRLSVWAITGAVGVSSLRKGERAQLYNENDQYRLEVLAPVAGQGSQVSYQPVRQIWFDRRTLQVVQEDLLDETGRVEATIRFSDFRPVNAPVAQETASAPGKETMLQPFLITTEDGRGSGTLRLTFREIVPNPPLKPEELEPVIS